MSCLDDLCGKLCSCFADSDEREPRVARGGGGVHTTDQGHQPRGLAKRTRIPDVEDAPVQKSALASRPMQNHMLKNEPSREDVTALPTYNSGTHSGRGTNPRAVNNIPNTASGRITARLVSDDRNDGDLTEEWTEMRRQWPQGASRTQSDSDMLHSGLRGGADNWNMGGGGEARRRYQDRRRDRRETQTRLWDILCGCFKQGDPEPQRPPIRLQPNRNSTPAPRNTGEFGERALGQAVPVARTRLASVAEITAGGYERSIPPGQTIDPLNVRASQSHRAPRPASARPGASRDDTPGERAAGQKRMPAQAVEANDVSQHEPPAHFLDDLPGTKSGDPRSRATTVDKAKASKIEPRARPVVERSSDSHEDSGNDDLDGGESLRRGSRQPVSAVAVPSGDLRSLPSVRRHVEAEKK